MTDIQIPPAEFTVEVRQETPFLPKVAFVTITLASLGGAVFTGRSLGVGGGLLGPRWLAMWVGGLILGFSTWWVVYLRRREVGLDPARVEGLVETAEAYARRIRRVLAAGAILVSPVPLLLGYLDTSPARGLLVALPLAMAVLLLAAKRSHARVCLLVTSAVTTTTWAWSSTGGGLEAGVRSLHLLAFGLWIGGALWNLTVAIPAGRAHPVIDAVVAEARQLQRFRWVVRFSLPTIIVTGLIQTEAYRFLPIDWWVSYPGVLIPTKVLLIIALVVIFITCPLYRQCSPVVGVCRVDDVDQRPASW